MRAVMVLVLLLSGCTLNIFMSEEGQLSFHPEGLTAGPVHGVHSKYPVVEGTLFCAEVCTGNSIGCSDEDIEIAARCFERSVTGSAVLTAVPGCLHFTTTGPAVWSFDPVECGGLDEGMGLVPDRVELESISRDDLDAQLVFPGEFFVARLLDDEDSEAWTTAEGGGIPEGVMPEPGETMVLVAGGRAEIDVGLVQRDRRGPVVWDRTGTHMELVSSLGTVPDPEESEIFWTVFHPELGDTGEVWLHVEDRSWLASEYEVVGESRMDSLEIVVVYSAHEEEGHDGEPLRVHAPLGARAIIRDKEGRPMFGAPVRWGIEGQGLGVQPENDASYVQFNERLCVPPSQRTGAHSTLLQARAGDLYDEIEVDWVFSPGAMDPDDPDPDLNWSPSEYCAGPLVRPVIFGCGCAHGGPAGAAWLLALLPLWVWRRSFLLRGPPPPG